MKILSALRKYYYWAIVFLLASPAYVFADKSLTVDLSSEKFNPINQKDIYGLINAIIDFIVKIGAVIVVFFIIYAGFLFVTAQGNEDKISKAKTTFLWTIIGSLVLLGASTLSGVICNTARDLGAEVSCNGR